MYFVYNFYNLGQFERLVDITINTFILLPYRNAIVFCYCFYILCIHVYLVCIYICPSNNIYKINLCMYAYTVHIYTYI